MQLLSKVDGVIIGLLLGFRDGRPLVVFAGNPKDHAVPARSLARLDTDAVGSEVALLYEDGDPNKPLIVGRIIEPGAVDTAVMVVRDGEHVAIKARERIELRVGQAAIIMEKDGRITIRGTTLVSHASAANRIRGGSVSLN